MFIDKLHLLIAVTANFTADTWDEHYLVFESIAECVKSLRQVTAVDTLICEARYTWDAVTGCKLTSEKNTKHTDKFIECYSWRVNNQLIAQAILDYLFLRAEEEMAVTYCTTSK